MKVGLGVLQVLAGGVLNGSFVAPMKVIKTWKWENSWLVYSIVGLTIIPWMVAFATVPNLTAVYAHSSNSILLKVILFGIGWGIGSVLFGIGVIRLGLALGYGIILGLIAPIGTFLPLIVLHPERLHTREGRLLIVGMLLVLVGISFLAIAGKRREQDYRAKQVSDSRSSGTFFFWRPNLRPCRHFLANAQLQLCFRPRNGAASRLLRRVFRDVRESSVGSHADCR